jgi:energy-coupling factor transporter ATP-binding protein EcfA2
MVAPLPDKAQTLKDAFQACDVGALGGETLRYYVDLKAIRSMKPIAALRQRLEFLNPGQFASVLFTGHRGCGKSTELRRLQHQFEQDYRVIYLESDDVIDTNDADYTDLYLLILQQVSDDMARLGLEFDRRLLNSFKQWFLEIVDETEESVEKSVSLETSAEAKAEVPFLSKLSAKLLAQIKGSNKQKRVVRDKLEKDIGRLKGDLNLLLKDAYEKVRTLDGKLYQKGFLVILDNLDRVPPKVGDRLYFDHATQLQDLNCTLIFTVPMSIIYSDRNIHNAFSRKSIHCAVIPMVNIYKYKKEARELQLDLNALEQLSQLIAKRVDVNAVFETDSLLIKLVTASGGHPRLLMQMMANACLVAESEGRAKLQDEDVNYVIRQEQFNFERIIPETDYPLMVQICCEKQVKQDEHGQRMLFNTSVLEYESECWWNYVSPIVQQSKSFQKAFKAANGCI